MLYEIEPVTNGFILRGFTPTPVTVGNMSYPLGRSLSFTEVYPTINACVNAIRDKVAAAQAGT